MLQSQISAICLLLPSPAKKKSELNMNAVWQNFVKAKKNQKKTIRYSLVNSLPKRKSFAKVYCLKELQETAETARKAAEEQAASAVNLVKEKEKTNIMLTEKLRDAEQKAGNYDTLEKENASLKQKVSVYNSK